MRHIFLVWLMAGSLLVSCSSRLSVREAFYPGTYPADLAVVTRQQWGWQPLKQKPAEQRIEKITIHHGGVEFKEDQDVALYLKNLQAWSRAEKNWPDMPYHFMIDLQGNIFEGRPLQFPGNTNTDYDVNGHAQICVLGNYEEQVIVPEQLESLIALTAFLAAKYEVPLSAIKGHKDHTETLCPGKDLYRYLEDGTIYQQVRQRLKEQAIN